MLRPAVMCLLLFFVAALETLSQNDSWQVLRESGKAAASQQAPNAESLLKQALAAAKAESPAGNHFARSSCDLAQFYFAKGKAKDALKLVRTSVEIWQNDDARNEVDFSECIDLLADIIESTGKPEEAAAIRASIPIHFKISGTVKGGVYESSKGDFKVKLPHLLKPGAHVEDGTTQGMMHFSCRDDLGRTFDVVVVNRRPPDEVMESMLSNLPGDLREKEKLITSRGEEWRYVTFVKGGSPATIQSFDSSGEQTRPQRADILFAGMLLRNPAQLVMVRVGESDLSMSDTPRDQAKDNQSVKEALSKFLEGLSVNTPPQ